MQRTLVSAFGLAVALAASLSADNLIQNRGFATDLSGWTITSYTLAEWSAFDHGGGGSGSALLTSNGNPGDAPNTALYQCVAVAAGHRYAFGASIYISAESAPAAVITPIVDVRFFPNPNCSGTLLAQQVSSSYRILRDEWHDVQSRFDAPAGAVSAIAYFGGVDFAGNAATETIQVYVDDGYFQSDANCVATQTQLCLGGRFLVYGDFYVPAQDRHGFMQAVPATADSGLFWFFAPDNLEVFAKVLNACSNPFNRYWVFAAGLTNVQVSLHVDDTVSGATRLYENLAGTAFPPIQDTQAFATCP